MFLRTLLANFKYCGRRILHRGILTFYHYEQVHGQIPAQIPFTVSFYRRNRPTSGSTVAASVRSLSEQVYVGMSP